MRTVLKIMTLASLILMGGGMLEARTSVKGKTRSNSKVHSASKVNYRFKETTDGFKSPEGHTYTAKLGTARQDEIACTKAVITFIDPEIVKISYFTSEGWQDEEKYYAWHQDKDYIFISDDKDPLRISENGKTLTSVYTGPVFNIGDVKFQRPAFSPDVERDIIFKDLYYGTPWILSPDGTATRQFNSELSETGNYKELGNEAYKLEFNSTPDYKYQHSFHRYVIVGDTVYSVHDAYCDSDGRLMSPRIDEFTYNPEDRMLTITKVNGSSDVMRYMDKIFNPEIYGRYSTPSVPLSKLSEVACRWQSKSKENDGENQLAGSFNYKGQRFILLKNGSVILKDRSREGMYEQFDDGKSYQVYTWSPFYEGGDSFLIIGENVYAIDRGCCDCIYSYTYDWKNKVVVMEGGCSGEDPEYEQIPLSKMKPVATITWY